MENQKAILGGKNISRKYLFVVSLRLLPSSFYYFVPSGSSYISLVVLVSWFFLQLNLVSLFQSGFMHKKGKKATHGSIL